MSLPPTANREARERRIRGPLEREDNSRSARGNSNGEGQRGVNPMESPGHGESGSHEDRKSVVGGGPAPASAPQRVHGKHRPRQAVDCAGVRLDRGLPGPKRSLSAPVRVAIGRRFAVGNAEGAPINQAPTKIGRASWEPD